MAEEISISGSTKAEIYSALLPQLKGLMQGEPNIIANLANIAAGLKEAFGFFWVGFYLVEDGELVLAPFQGPVACTRIQKGKGVCGTAWENDEVIIVEDVEQFPGHIACNAASKSEIVLPIHKNGVVTGVLDIDSDSLNDFDETDRKFLLEVVKLIETII